MSALREEALQIVNEMPEDLLAALLKNLQTFKYEKFNSRNRIPAADGFDPKKLAAFKAMEELRVRNRKYFKGVDLEQEFLEAIDEKFSNPR